MDLMFDFFYFVQKHGIVLGPDLNINGDIGEAEVDGSPSGDSAGQPAQDSQTSPAEGNSMLGKTHCGIKMFFCLNAWLSISLAGDFHSKMIFLDKTESSSLK